MPMIVIFDFVIPHQLMVLFLMVLVSNVTVFLNLCHLFEQDKVPAELEAKLKFSKFKKAMFIVYGALAGLSLFPATGAYCRESLVYRKTFSTSKLAALMFIWVFLANLGTVGAAIYYYRRG